MKIKPSDIPRISAKKIMHRKNGNSQPVQVSGVNLNSEIVPENEYVSKLHKMQLNYSKSEKKIEQLRKQLSESESFHTKFISIIAHDLRSPFQVILGSLELIKMRRDSNDIEDNTYIDMASESALRTLKLLDDLLHWTISQKTDKSINTTKLNLYDLVENEIAFQIYSAKQKDLSINHSIEHDLNVAGDLQMVKTILRNLMDNAIKYTNPGGEVSISAHENTRFVQIAVSDTGIGMSRDKQKKLFKIETLHSTSGTKNEYGYGFGLILCKELIEMHGGVLSVESLQGKGSKFIFTLPHYI